MSDYACSVFSEGAIEECKENAKTSNTRKYIRFASDALNSEDLDILSTHFLGKTFHTSTHNGIKVIETDWEIVQFGINKYSGNIEVQVENVTWREKGSFQRGWMDWNEVKHLIPVQHAYEIEKWDLRKICLTPHTELDNCFWIAYDGHRIGMLSQDFEGEISSEICVIRPKWVALALCTDISFSAEGARQAIVQLMLNGVL